MEDLIRVLVVDDQLVQREGIAKVVENTGKMHVVGTASNAVEAVQLIDQQPAELALIDLVLHDLHGTEVGRVLRRRQPELKVIIYTREKSMVLAAEIFRERKELAQPGLHGYLLTRNISSSQYLLQVYQQILQFGHFIDPDILHWYYRFAELEVLTRREEECALMIAKGLSNAQIASQMIVSRRRVENLINSLYQKFRILGEPGDPARRVLLAESIRLLTSYKTIDKVLSVLIVEDQQEQRERLLRELDGDERFKVLAAVETGNEALQIARQLRPEVILVDLRLPDMDGFQVTRRLVEELPRCKVFMNSSISSTVFEQQALESGAIAYLPKRSLSADKIFELYDSHSI